jgi:hypothetical protein
MDIIEFLRSVKSERDETGAAVPLAGAAKAKAFGMGCATACECAKNARLCFHMPQVV